MVKSQSIFSKYEQFIKDDLTLATSSNKGISPNAFNDLASVSGLNRNSLAEEIFSISLKTISRYQKENKNLNPRNSELALKLILLYKKGAEVFGSSESFNNWVSKSAFGLGGIIPYSFLNTSTGIDLILEELVRIEYGDLA